MRLFLRRWLKATTVLPALALLSFACAYRGWTGQGVRVEDAFFLSLEALKLGSEYKRSDGWVGNRWLEAARLFGLAFYLLTLFKAFGLLLRIQIRELAAQIARRDLVCIGDHPSFANIGEATARHGRPTLWLGGNPPAATIHHLRAITRAWREPMIRQFRLRRAKMTVVAFKDDMTAVSTTLTLTRSGVRPIIMLAAGQGAADAAKTLQPRSMVRIVAADQPVVRCLHERYPPFLAPRASDQDALVVLIVGRGGAADAVFADLLLSSLTSDLGPPSIAFLAPQARELAAVHALRFPDLHRSVSIEYFDAPDDPDGGGLITGLRDFAGLVTNAYVCLDDDGRSLGAAAALDRLATERDWPVTTIFVHQQGGRMTITSEPEAEVQRLMLFGAADEIARGLGLLDASDDANARLIHDTYRRFASSPVAALSWEELPEDLRDANRRQAAHLPAKLVSAGVPLDDWLAARRSGGSPLALPALPSLDDPALLDRLARLEHARWMVERRLNGWQFGHKRDDRRRRHPDLVSFDELTQQSKDYDVEMLRALAARTVGRSLGPPLILTHDWSTIATYPALAKAAMDAHGLSPEAFVAGPFRRFLEMCSTDEHARLRARAMEFAREAVCAYARSLTDRGGPGETILPQAQTVAAHWFRHNEVADAEYMLEVLAGVSTHNYRTSAAQSLRRGLPDVLT